MVNKLEKAIVGLDVYLFAAIQSKLILLENWGWAISPENIR